LFVAGACLIGQLSQSGLVMGAEGDPDAGQRLVWRYRKKGESYYLFASGKDEWRAARPDNKEAVYREIESNPTSIRLQNTVTKLYIQLESDFGYWRRPKDEEWTRWVQGRWLDPDKIPEAVREQIAAPMGTVDSPLQPAEDQSKVAPEIPSSRTEQSREYKIRLVYLVPKDRQPVREYRKKIGVIMSIVSTVIRDDLVSKGYKTPGLSFEMDGDEPLVHVVRGRFNTTHYNGAPNYDGKEQVKRIMVEVKEAVGSSLENLLVVLAETYDPGPADVLWPGVLARGGYYGTTGGIAVYSAHLLRDDVGLRAMVYVDARAGSVVGGRALTGKEASFQDPIPPSLVHNGEIDLRVLVTDEGGNRTKFEELFRLTR
jgi:hypothetical protein